MAPSVESHNHLQGSCSSTLLLRAHCAVGLCLRHFPAPTNLIQINGSRYDLPKPNNDQSFESVRAGKHKTCRTVGPEDQGLRPTVLRDSLCFCKLRPKHKYDL